MCAKSQHFWGKLEKVGLSSYNLNGNLRGVCSEQGLQAWETQTRSSPSQKRNEVSSIVRFLESDFKKVPITPTPER
jgi:hypothetical protein